MEPSYAVRVGLWAGETAFRQTDDELVWQDSRSKGSLSYRQVSDIQVFKIRYFGSRRSYWRCVLRDQANRTIVLQAAHRVGLRRIEDRTPTYIPFIKQLESRIRAANPDVSFRSGQNWLSAWDAVTGILVVAGLRAARILSCEKSAAIASTLLRTIGPHLKGHRIARANLTAAFPEKSEVDVEKILAGMWDGLGRVIAEYAHLGRVWDFDRSGRTSGRIVMDEANKSRYLAMRVTKGPAMIFGAHLANWEMLCWALGTSDAETAVVYRPPKIPSVHRELAILRSGSKVQYIPADVNGPFKLMNVMRRDGWIGLLVDEPDPRGMMVKFFGRKCSAKPLFAKIARQFDCPIYGARIIRQADGKLALDLTGPVSLPRDASGKIDVPAATQYITDIIEGWIREYPEQWLWLQRRWR